MGSAAAIPPWLENIASGEAQFGEIVYAFNACREHAERFEATRASVRHWLLVRIASIRVLQAQKEATSVDYEYLEGAIGRFSAALRQMEAGEDAFIPSHPNAALGITIPSTPARNTDDNIYGAHLED